MPELSQRIIENLRSQIERGDATKEEVVASLRKRGYDTSAFETFGDDLLQELAAFGKGIPEGASFNLLELDEVPGAYKTDIPILGEVTPSRELGRLLGGGATGTGLFNIGRRVASPVAGQAVRKLLGKGAETGVGRGAVWTGETAAAMLPETGVATSAEIWRTDDLDQIGNTVALWMTLGVGGEALANVGGRFLKRVRESRGKRTSEINHDLAEIEKMVTGEGAFTPIEPEDLEARTYVGPEEPIPVDEAPDLTPPWEKQASADAFLGPERMPDADFETAFGENAFPRLGETVDQHMQRVARNVKVRYVDHIPSRPGEEDKLIGGRYTGNEVLISRPALEEKFRDKAWTKPQVPGVKPLPENAFRTYGEFEAFSLRHELMHATVPQREAFKGFPKESKAAYEDRINALALGDSYVPPLPSGVYHGLRFEDSDYAIREVMLEPAPLVYPGALSPDDLMRIPDRERLLMRMSPRQRQGMERLQGLADSKARFNETESMFLMSARSQDVSEYIYSRQQLHGSPMQGKEIGELLETVFRLRAEFVPELADQALLRNQPEYRGFLTNMPAHKLDTPSFMLGDPRATATASMRGEMASLIDELSVRGVDVRQDMVPEKMTQEEAIQALGDLRQARSVKMAEEEDAIYNFFAKGDEHPGEAVKLREEMTDSAYPAVPTDAEMVDIQPWYRFFSNTSRVSMGRNASTQQAQWKILNWIEEDQGRFTGWWNQVREINKLLGMPSPGARTVASELVTRVRGQSTQLDAARERAHTLTRLLDEGVESDWAKSQLERQGMREAYQLSRKLLKEVADELGLPEGQRLNNYIAHVFTGNAGKMRARVLAGRLGPGKGDALLDLTLDPGERTRRQLREKVEEVFEEEAPDLRARPFGHLLPRTKGLQGFEGDFSTIMNIYLRGASSRIASEKIAHYGLYLYNRLPRKTREGGATQIRPAWRDYMKHVLGSSTPTRQWISGKFRNSNMFNRLVDGAVEWVGDAEERQVLRRLNMTDQEWNGLPENDRSYMISQADAFLKQLGDRSRVVDNVTGKRIKGNKAQRMRAKTALKIDDIRVALSDPHLQQPVLQQIYRTQMLAKLGINFAHGLINTTQTLVNGWPMLDADYTSRGIANFFYKNNPSQWEDKAWSRVRNDDGSERIITPKEILNESGMLSDASKVEEFIELVDAGSFFKMMQDAALTPSRWSERFNRSSVVLGAYEQFRDQGLDHVKALDQARQLSLKANFPFNVAGTPPVLRPPMLRLLFMFSSYRIHQTSFTGDMVLDAMDYVRTKGDKGSIQPLLRHGLAYGLLLGAGLSGWSSTNIGDRSQHPATETVTDVVRGTPRYGLLGGVMETISGPFADTLVEMMHWNVMEAVTQLAVPSTLQRMQDTGVPDSKRDVVELLGLKAYDPRERRPRRPRRPRLED